MSDLYIGPNRISADIEDRSGLRIGAGPLVTVLSLDYGYRLSEAGDFNATITLSDPRTNLIIPKAVILAFYFDEEFLFRGIVEQTSKSVDRAGILRLSVKGRDLTGELAEAPVGELSLVSGGAGVTNGPALILGAANLFNGSAWALDTTDGFATTTASLYGKYSGESALTALVMAGQKAGEHWRIASDGTRGIVWLRAQTADSGVRAVQTAGEPVQAEDNPTICFIQSFQENVDAYRLVTRIYPYGAGDGEMRLTLRTTTRAAPAGFTLSKPNNYISSDDAVTTIGKSIAIAVRFQDIRPVSNTSADMTSAANMLFDAALAYLKRHDAASDLKTYQMSVLKLPRRVQVGEIITVEYQDQSYVVAGEQMVILAIRTRIDSSGVRMSELTVAGVARWLEDANREIIGGMEQSKLFTSHPQRGPNSYVTSFQKYVFHDGSASEVAQIRWRFGPEVCQLNQVAFDFETASATQMLPLESTVRSVSGSSSTTTNGGGTTTNTPSGGGSTTVSGGGSTTVSGGGSTTPSGGGATSGNSGSAVLNHSHDVEVSGLSVTSGSPVYFNTTNGLHTASGAGLQSGPGTVSRDLQSHTHSTPAHTHSTPDHTHSTPNHTHATPDHQHSVTIPDHSHSVTPVITALYGVFRESGGNTFNLADLDYRVNSESTWHDLAAAVTNLGSNWFRLDITEVLYDANFVPLQANNLLEFRRKPAGSYASRKSCMIDGQLLVRNIIQSVSLE